MVAAAQVMTSPNATLKRAIGKPQEWQREAWGYYDEIGELRFGVGWLANGMSRINLIPARTPQSPGDEPGPIAVPDPDDPNDETPPPTPVEARAVELVELMAGGAIGQGQMLAEFGKELVVAGLAWLVAEPDPDDPESDEFVGWSVLSVEELRVKQGSRPNDPIYEQQTGDSEWTELHPNALVVKVWRKHPRRHWQPDAPTRAILSTLREIDLLTKHIHATAISRLAGAGLLILPTEAEFPGTPPPVQGDGDPDTVEAVVDERTPEDIFVDTLVQTMTIPIGDRSSPGAVVPLVVRVPGERGAGSG